MGETMIPTDEELMTKIENALKEYQGPADNFYEAVGMVVVGRLTGWRVMRLVSSRRCWSMATRIFGDPKEWMPKDGDYGYKSLGLKIAERLGGYWDFVSGKKARDLLPLEDRKMME